MSLSRKRGLVPDGRRTRDADLRSADADLHADRAIPDGLSGRRPILQDQTPGPQLAAVEGSVPALAKHRRARAGHAGLHRRAITGPERRRTKAGGSPSIRLSHARAVFRRTVRKNRTVSPEAEFHKRDRSRHPPDSRTAGQESSGVRTSFRAETKSLSFSLKRPCRALQSTAGSCEPSRNAPRMQQAAIRRTDSARSPDSCGKLRERTPPIGRIRQYAVGPGFGTRLRKQADARGSRL